ncbi:hypothetical protein ACUXAV_006427 [Cupriavidus metallidurans]|jgi:hypothetical protein|uniref:hypothetical protein n=1 Tax=Cupriavidus sp. TaxID=1873897 RepID=UPI000A87C180|nr:hypothetical protein [Cupriavidus sp.]MCA3194160.1 hypothetical protein [Cupriavidus sp.]MCA3775548.1 hypothetical protein [Cutibacterium sp.]GMG94861.1 hypothetical protein Cmtc_60810 [Cupriavidus sp. TKC]
MNNKIACHTLAGRAAVSAGVAALLSLVCTNALAAAPKDVLFAAIRSGQASEILNGPVAENWQSKSHSTAPVLMSAKVVKRYKGECARLRVTMRQEHVPLKDGGAAPLEFSYELNLCTDGSPPAETVDWSAVPQETPERLRGQLR